MKKNFQQVQSRIEKAAFKSGRNIKNISIVAVTKSFPPGIWDFALEYNLPKIGESRIQETEIKNKKFQKRKKIELHFIGHLQANKARKAIKLFDIIQTVDTLKLAKRINTIAKEEKKTQKIFLQSNIGADPQKHGFFEHEIIEATKKIVTMEGIKLIGIMTIPPNNITKKKLQSIYNKTRRKRDIIFKTIEKECKNLSMGMSNDYEIAITEGSTHIRLGTALFGDRPQKK